MAVDSTPPDVMPEKRQHAFRHWLAWAMGVALVIGMSLLAMHYSEAEEIARIAEHAQPWWLTLAVALQLGTYLAQAEIWRIIARAASFRLSSGEGFRLSFAKLFIDQVLPSAGISGTAAVSHYFAQRGMQRPAVMASIVVSLSTYFVVYVILLVVALPLLPMSGSVRATVLTAAAIFIAGSLAIVASLFAMSGRPHPLIGRFARTRALQSLLSAIEQADKRVARDPRVLCKACAYQIAIIVLDAATVWVLVKALGANAPAAAVFASFMISNLFRTIGILPGGLGTFEASSVLSLQWIGVPLPVALSATLLFRGLSFWLPMLPGMWLSRQMFRTTPRAAQAEVGPYWSGELDHLIARLDSSLHGLSNAEAEERLQRYGMNELRTDRPPSRGQVLLRQLSSPLLLLLLFAAIIAAFTGETTDALIVFIILGASITIGYKREYSAHVAAASLRERIRVRATVLRDGAEKSIPVEQVVPGDIVRLSAGSLVPADGRLIETADCFLSEAVLTGESFPVEKSPGELPIDAPQWKRSNCVYLGTSVRSGSARFIVVATGPATKFGSIAQRLSLRPPQTEFDRGISRFGYLLTSAMLVMVLVVFVAHMLAHRPVVETLLFAVALAVGLSPELLPAILSVNLARGAQMLAKQGVLVRHLNAIENLGSMDVLCTDKTGTLTEGVVMLDGAFDAKGNPSKPVLELGAINAALESGLASPLDDAILTAGAIDRTQLHKLAEIPFDFVRKRVSVVIERDGHSVLISKGAVAQVLSACAVLADGTAIDTGTRAELERQVTQWSDRGIRVLAVATRKLARQQHYDRSDEQALTFEGFLTFLDRPKEGAKEALESLGALGVGVKLITGDSQPVAQHIARLVGLNHERVLTGAQLDELGDEALWREAEQTDLFVEVDPNQKERIILSLKKMGHVVGFLGDGVNDAPAMHAADTSLSVEQAADVARQAADFVLVERNLDAIRRGIEEGRRTFANTLKYVLTTTSANLGNMVSMAAASLYLPFLPLTASQILLNNFLSDIPAIGLANDNVDRELIDRPRRWDIRFIGRFMVQFGLLSSLFDFLTFGALLWVFHASAQEFRTGWFIESLLTELVIALVVRTRRLSFKSRPGSLLLGSTIVLIVLTPLIPYLPFASLLEFVPIPGSLLTVLVAITAAYAIAAEAMKHWFYRNDRATPAPAYGSANT